MPRVKLGQDRRAEKIKALLWGAKAVNGLQEKDMAEMIGVTATTFRKYKAEPLKLSLEQFYKLATGLHIPVEELRESITIQR